VTAGTDDPDSPLEVELEYRVADWARRQGERFAGELPWLYAVEKSPLELEDREIPVDFGFTLETREEVKIGVPEGFFVVAVPKRSTARMAELNYKATHEMERTSLASTRKVTVRETLVEEIDYPKLKKLYDKVAAADAATFTVGRQPVRMSTGTR
jgi:hypothetical protein